MKNIYEVLRQKELELSRLEKEVEALRVAAPLLSEGDEADNDNPTLASPSAVNAVPRPDSVGGTTEQGAGHSPSAAEKTKLSDTE